MSGGAGYKKMTEVWGRARTAFIRAQMANGRSRTQAIENWNATRKKLKHDNVNYPPSSLHKGVMSTLTDEEQAEYKKQERLHQAREQQKAFQDKQRDERAKKRREGNLDETDPQLPGGSNTETPRALAPDEEETPSGQEVNLENAQFQLITDEEQAELDELLGIHTTPNRANDLQDMAPPTGAEALPAPDPGRKRPAADATDGDSPGENENMGKGS